MENTKKDILEESGKDFEESNDLKIYIAKAFSKLVLMKSDIEELKLLKNIFIQLIYKDKLVLEDLIKEYCGEKIGQS